VKSAEPLPNTKPLTEEGDLAAKMVAGIHKYLDRALAENETDIWKRSREWPKDDAERAKAIEDRRAYLRKSLGVVEKRLAPKMEFVGGPDEPHTVFECPAYTIYSVRWAVLPGIDGEGLLFEPKGEKVAASVVAIPDPAWTPEVFAGVHPGGKKMTEEEERIQLQKGLLALPVLQIPRRLAENGCRVVVPVLIDRNDELSANPKLNRATNQSHREFIHRMAYEMGRTLLGYEVQKVLAAADWLAAKDDKAPVAVWGMSEGGLLAIYAAQCEAKFKFAVLSGYYANFYNPWKGPLYHNVWGLLSGPSHYLVGHAVDGTTIIRHDVHPIGIPEPVARPGRATTAAPGGIPGPYPGKEHTFPVFPADAAAMLGQEAMVKAAEV
jgi:dienelactone hydrolase